MTNLYDKDVYTWALQQADALRRRSANEIDWDNVAEEIESVGKTEARELESRFAVLLTHLLKWRFQAEKRSGSWRATIRIQRIELTRLLEQNPGLKPRRDELLGVAYQVARIQAAGETELPEATFPDSNPFTLSEVLDPEFWPDAPAVK